MSRGLRALLLAGAAAAVAFNVVTFYVNSWPGPRAAPIYVISPTLVLVAYLGAGLVAWQHHPGERIGPLFTWTGYAWLLPSLTQVHAPLPYTIGNLTWYLYQAALAHLALAWPYGRLRSRLDRAVVTATYAWNIGNNALAMLFWNPRTSGCGSACPANLLLVDSSNSAHSTVTTATSVVSIALTAAVLALIGRNWRSARGYARRTMTRLIWVAVPIAAYVAVAGVKNGLGIPDIVLYGYGPLILILGPAGYLAGTVLARRAWTAVGSTIVGLGPGVPPDRIRDALARALGDPGLQIAFRLPGSDGYTDTAGQHVDAGQPPPGRMLTSLDPAGDTVLVFDEELRHEPELVRVTVAAASMSLEQARLRAEVQAQLEQVRASRARIVEAGDAARRRLERDLHDGAQQRLVTLTLALGMARNRAGGTDPELAALIESASKEAREALTELRELARGIHPAVLTETGLAGAVQALAERSPVPVTIIAVPDERFPAAIEATAYFVVCEALANVAKHARAGGAEVTIRQRARRLVVQVSDDGAGGARPEKGSGLRGLADRVAAAGGALRVDSPPGAGTRLEADIPCP